MLTVNIMKTAKNINHYTNAWSKRQGFKMRDLEDQYHPSPDDVVLIIMVKQQYSTYFDHSDWALWNGLNSMVKQKYKFKEKHLAQIEKLIIKATKAQEKQDMIKTKIQALRQQSENPGQNKNDKSITEG
jgi:hypothetical protein